MQLQLKHMTFDVILPEGIVADPKLLDGGHPLYYVVKNRKQTENYLNQVHELLKYLPQGMNVFELCAGIGLVAKTNWDVLDPNGWIGIELDKSCEPLNQEPRMNWVLGDMYETPIPSADLIICEFSNNTLPKMWREPKRKALLERIAAKRPKYWYIADVGYYWIHLANHWPIYQEKFGVQVTRENYAQLFDRYMRDNYGYTVAKTTVGGGAQYILLEPV